MTLIGSILRCNLILQYLFVILFVLEYFFGKKNENCPIGRIITTEEECKEASWQLGIEYENELKDVNYPVGCYWKSDSSSYLNTQLEPSTSAPGNIKNHSGICKKGMTIYFVCHILDFILALMLTTNICEI